MTDRIDKRLDDYRLLRFLGEGTFGDVYYGEHVYQNTPAAIKVFKTKLTPDKLKDFINEVRTLMLLKHANIIQLLDFDIGENDIPPYLVMDYAPNGTLRQRHQRGTHLPLATVVTYVKQVAAALQYAHDQRRIHRDVKPENMLVGHNNEILLSDFGIAAVAHGERSMKTQEVAGTAPYMAPEQIQGRPCPASDQYALGIVVYEWLCGVRPFQGETEYEFMKQHMEVPPPPLRDRLATISPEVEQVIMTALAKDPGQRFKRVQAFAVALEEASKSGLAPEPPIILPSPPTPAATSGQQRQGTNGSAAIPYQTTPFIDGMDARGTVRATENALHPKRTINIDPAGPVSGGAKDSSAFAPAPFAPRAHSSPSGTGPGQANAANASNGESSSGSGSVVVTPKRPGATGDVPKAAPVAPVPSPPSPANRTSRQQNSSNIGAVGAGAAAGAAGGILAGRAATGGGAPPIVHGTPSSKELSGGFRGLGISTWQIALALLLLSLVLCSGVAFALPNQTQAVTSTMTRMVSNLINPQPSSSSPTTSITPASKVVQDSYSIQAVPSGANAVQQQVAARIITASPSQQKTVTATEHVHSPGAQATGSLTFFNGSASPYTVGAGTVFTDANGIQVTNNVPAVIPATGSVAVPAHAVNPGAVGNIPASDFNFKSCCGSSVVSVSNTAPFTGGQDAKDYMFLQQSDVDRVANPLKDTLLAQAKSSVKSQILPTEQPATTLQCTSSTATVNVPVGDTGVNVTSATVTVSVSCSQEVYDQHGVQTLVEGLLKQKAAADPTLAGYALVGDIVSTTKVQHVDPKTGIVTLGVTAKGVWVYQ